MEQPTSAPQPEFTDGYSVEPGLVNARHFEPDWGALFTRRCHPTNPTLAQSDACYDGLAGDAHPDSCYTCDFEACPDCSNRLLTPRMAYFLHLSAVLLSDQFTMELELAELRPDGTIDPASYLCADLPRVVAASMTEAWALRFIAAFDTIAGRIAAGANPSPNCTGEEMALHLIIASARDHYDDGHTEAVFGERYAGLPVHDDDADFDRIADLAFEDHDVLWLFDAALDGIESASDPIAAQLGAVNLHPAAWFLPFDDRTSAV